MLFTIRDGDVQKHKRTKKSKRTKGTKRTKGIKGTTIDIVSKICI